MSISEGEGVFMEKADLTMLKKATKTKNWEYENIKLLAQYLNEKIGQDKNFEFMETLKGLGVNAETVLLAGCESGYTELVESLLKKTSQNVKEAWLRFDNDRACLRRPKTAMRKW